MRNVRRKDGEAGALATIEKAEPMDEPPTTSPFDARREERPASSKRSRGRLWAQLLLTMLLILVALGYIISQQSPDLLLRVIATFTPPTAIPTATAIPTPTPSQQQLAAILRVRPLRLPTLSPGSPCPVTPTQTLGPNVGDAIGDGPVYLYSTRSTVFFPPTQSGDAQEWVSGALLFLIKPGVEGAVLVRGHQVDGPVEVRFGKGDAPDADLVFTAPAQARLSTDDAWSIFFSDIRLREAGCYAVQVDSEAASSVIIFRAAQEQG
jgi:hypothetical protein